MSAQPVQSSGGVVLANKLSKQLSKKLTNKSIPARSRNLVATEHFSLGWRIDESRPSTDIHTAVSKKLLPRAVDRNRVKRLMRAASSDLQLPSMRLLFRLTVKPITPFSKSDRQCKRLLREEMDRTVALLLRRLS